MMLRTDREAQPAPFRVRSDFVGKLTLEDEQLGTLLIGDDSKVCLRPPTLEAHQVREAGLPVERLVSYGRNRAGLPRELVGVDGYVAPLPTRELPQLHEQDATGFRKGGMALGLGAHSIRVVSATAWTERFPLIASPIEFSPSRSIIAGAKQSGVDSTRRRAGTSSGRTRLMSIMSRRARTSFVASFSAFH
jgi:hypothetical protein